MLVTANEPGVKPSVHSRPNTVCEDWVLLVAWLFPMLQGDNVINTSPWRGVFDFQLHHKVWIHSDHWAMKTNMQYDNSSFSLHWQVVAIKLPLLLLNSLLPLLEDTQETLSKHQWEP